MRQNNSPWLHNFEYKRELTQMTGSRYTDICIIGGGIAGVTTAYMLLKFTDKKIILLEGDKIAHGATGHNAGYILAEFEKSFKEIVKEHGLEKARSGYFELKDALQIYKNLNKEIGLGEMQEKKSVVTYSTFKHFDENLHEEFLKYGEIKSKIYLYENSPWLREMHENFKNKIEVVSIEKMHQLLGTEKKDVNVFQAIIIETMLIGNSAVFTETLAKYCEDNYKERFQIYEKTFVNSIRLLQNNNCIIDSLYGVCVSDKVVLCTNGFENFNIYGPYGMEIDKEFHHNISGLIGYMIGTFTKDKNTEDSGGIFYEEGYETVKDPIEAGPYIYYTKRHFKIDTNNNGELFSIGGPEIKLDDRKLYKKDHEVDENIYKELESFQKNIFNIFENPTFKWHGLMGYTKTGIRIVGKDKRFSDLLYNLGCNGIGIVPSVAGALRIARIVNRENLPSSIFDPR